MTDDELTRALRVLPTHDLDPDSARAIASVSESRLHVRAKLSPLDRLEPPLLMTLASAHLLWLIVTVFMR
jgi:hypothetical protein